MASVSVTQSHFSENVTWDNLKRAIASSSGFQRWQAEQTETKTQPLEKSLDAGASLDHLVSRYLRETLETLAY
ncbi:hypothetical protein C7B61_15445 [filamentous cyanobacterium CCP1]|nr:hypothetical protein C7B76_02915 [filamentous cyanobacterium CCP2]PSB61772.1 hypothetical protein C7B61_15445 [filamentous cyanobacterium CCP1]